MGLGAAAAFVVSTVHIPVGVIPMHLGLYGLLGILLGKRAFPALYICLLFQTLLLQHGGLFTLGVNSLNMGVGALLGSAIWTWAPGAAALRAGAAGFAGALVPALLLAFEFALASYGRGFFFFASLYAVVAVIESAVTVAAVGFLRRAKPDLLTVPTG